MIRQKRKKARIIRRAIIAAAMLTLFIVLAFYMFFGLYFKKHFFYQTKLDGIDVGGMTAEDAKLAVKSEVNDYLLTIFDRDGNKYHIRGADIDYDYLSTGEEEKLIKKQKSFTWPAAVFHKKELDMDKSITYSEELLENQVKELDCLQPENMTEPEDAYIKTDENGYELVPEKKGNSLLADKVLKEVRQAVDSGETELTLQEEDYKQPQITTEDETLSGCMKTIRNYLNTSITYTIAEEQEVLDEETIKTWIRVDEENQVSIDEKSVTDYVQSLASKYNTYGDVRKFKTTKGDYVEIGGGDYGWVVDKEKEKEQLIQELNEGTTVTREPVYSQTALYRSEDDIGDTYVELDYTAQHMWYYVNGELKLESDFVSGNISRGNGSPDGIYKIVYKKSPDVLRGENYESNVEYFMPFAYNVGFHDASWRSQFGGNIYKNSGSHGCINLPEEVAASLYKTLEVGTPVIAYYRDSVKLTAENTKISNAYSYYDKEKEERKAALEAERQKQANQQAPEEGKQILEDGEIIDTPPAE